MIIILTWTKNLGPRFFVVVFTLLVASAPAWSRPRPEALTGSWTKIFADIGYYSTKSNFSSDGGVYSDLGGGRSYMHVDSRLGIEHRFLPELSLFADLGLGYARSNDGFSIRQKGSATEVTAGARWLLASLPVAVTMEVLGFYALNQFYSDTDSVLTGEGASGAQGGFWAELRWRSLTPYAYVGARYQDGGRASLASGRLGMDWVPTTHDFFLGLAVRGHSVIVEDDYTTSAFERNAVTTRVNGGSLRYYAVNPRELAIEGNFGWNFSPAWSGVLFADYSINGANTAQGLLVLASLRWRMDHDEIETDRIRSRSNYQPREEYEDLRNFKPAREEYDPTLFEPKPKPKTKTDPKKKRDE